MKNFRPIITRYLYAVILLCSITAYTARSQSIIWKRLIAPDTAKGLSVTMTPTRDSGFVLAINTIGTKLNNRNSTFTFNVNHVRRLNMNGDSIWNYTIKPYPESDDDEHMYDIQTRRVYELPNGNIQIASGFGLVHSEHDVFNVRLFTPNGSLIWKSDSVSPAAKISLYGGQEKNGNGSFTGTTFIHRFGSNFTDTGYIRVVSADSSAKQLGTLDILTGSVYYPDYGTYTMKQMPDGGYILSAQLARFSDSKAIGASYLYRLDNTGAKLWERDISSADTAFFANDIVTAPDGGFTVLCWTIKNNADAQGYYSGNTTLIRYNAAGTKLWQRDFDTTALPFPHFGGSGKTSFHPVRFARTNDGGYMVTGYTASLNKNSWVEVSATRDTYVMRTDSNGNKLWVTELNIDSTYMDTPSEIYQLSDGSAAVVGVTYELGFRGRVFLVKLNDRVSGVRSDSREITGNLHISPNPATTRIRITANTGRAETILIYDPLGRIVATRTTDVNGIAEIDIQDLPAGVYRARIGTGRLGVVSGVPFVVLHR